MIMNFIWIFILHYAKLSSYSLPSITLATLSLSVLRRFILFIYLVYNAIFILKILLNVSISIPVSILYLFIILINPLASPSEGAPALKYGDVNTVTPSPRSKG